MSAAPVPLHPVLRAALDAAKARGAPALSAGTPDEARRLVAAGRAVLGAGPEVGPVTARAIPRRDGSTLGARLYRTADARECGLVVYLHGGGWVVGTLDDFDIVSRTIAARSGCAVVAVDYRLAPEHPFPAGLEDAIDASLWCAGACADLVGRRLPIVVAGDSAGANLATVAALALRREVTIALQALVYPVTDSDFDTPSYREHGTGLPLTADDMAWFLRHYAPPAAWRDPRIAPLRTPDLSGAPPAWIGVAAHDVLRDEGEAYAARLADAGVAVTLRRFDDLAHGFVRMPNLVDSADRALDALCAAIADACASGKADLPPA